MDEDLGQLVANPQVVTQATAEGAVLLEMATGDCFELNRIGAEIWSRFTRGETMLDIVAAVADQYHAPAAAVESDARGLIADLARHGLLTPPPR